MEREGTSQGFTCRQFEPWLFIDPIVETYLKTRCFLSRANKVWEDVLFDSWCIFNLSTHHTVLSGGCRRQNSWYQNLYE